LKLFARFIILGFAVLFACVPEDPFIVQDYGHDYFPLRVGMYSIFDVESIVYSQFNSSDEPETARYQLQTEVVDSFNNTAGTITYVIHRSTRPNSTAGWEFLDTWSWRIEGEMAVVQEGNTPVVKLAFPLAEGLRWNANAFNALEVDHYSITTLGAPLTVNQLDFTKTVTVEQEVYDDKVTRKDVRTEVYAKGVGLIRREASELVYCTQQVCLNNQIIESGTIYKQEITEYGIR
jgi:hypothetical protein